MSQQSVRQAARRSALDAQEARRRERADRERRLEALAVAVLTALGERDRAVKDAEMRAGEALRAMSVDEGLSVREAVEWCGTGITVREVSRLRRLAATRAPADGCATAERRRSGRAASGRERPGDGGAVPVKGAAGARESVRVLGRFALDLAWQGIQSGSAGCSGSAATPPGPCTRPTPQRLPSAATSAVRRVWLWTTLRRLPGSRTGVGGRVAVGERPVPRRRSTAVLNGAGPAVRPDWSSGLDLDRGSEPPRRGGPTAASP
jgi:hypothetical protein